MNAARLILWSMIVTWLLVASCFMATRASDMVTVTYLGTEINEGLPLNIFGIDCHGEEYEITLVVTFLDGSTSTHQGRYCGKFYVHGSVNSDAVTVAGVLPVDAPVTVHQLYLPLVRGAE